jgi:hypothetical protein
MLVRGSSRDEASPARRLLRGVCCEAAAARRCRGVTDSRGMVWEWCGECLTIRKPAWQMSSRLRRACAVRGKQDTVAAACGEAARQCAAGLWCRLEVQPFATRVYSIEINLRHWSRRSARPRGAQTGAGAARRAGPAAGRGGARHGSTPPPARGRGPRAWRRALEVAQSVQSVFLFAYFGSSL